MICRKLRGKVEFFRADRNLLLTVRFCATALDMDDFYHLKLEHFSLDNHSPCGFIFYIKSKDPNCKLRFYLKHFAHID